MQLRIRTQERQVRELRRGENGQVTIFVLLVLGLFLLGFVGFAVDMTNMWFHRQTAQGAADAACQAGIMDVLVLANGSTPPSPGFTPGTAFDCSGTSGASPCKYASLNGYNGTGLAANAESNDVAVSFPCRTCIPTLPPCSATRLTNCIPPQTLAPFPFLRVDLTDRFRLTFASLISGQRTMDVKANGVCALVLVQLPVPMIILDPTRPDSLDFGGTGSLPKITITGGPPQSIEVDSISTTAVQSNGNPTIDLSGAGPSASGGTIGVFGSELQSTAGFTFNNIVNPSETTEAYVSPQPPINDPFAQVPVPTKPGPPALGVLGKSEPAGTAPCPASAPSGCTEFSPGYYPTGILVKNTTAIFDNGIYYLDGPNGLVLDANGRVIPGPAGSGDGTGGTMFYFNGSGTLTVHSNPSGTFVGQQTANGTYIGSPSTDTAGTIPGLVFFQNRESQVSPNTGGGGTFVISGSLYFHQCKSADGTGLGTNCNKPPLGDITYPDPAHAYNDLYNLGGTSGGSTTITGEIIVDRLAFQGTPAVQMQLLPNFVFNILKATLMQ